MSNNTMNNFEEILIRLQFDNRRILLWGDVDDQIASSIISQLYLHYEKAPHLPVHLLINSHGGDASACEAMVDEIETLKNKGFVVSTMVQGIAASAGAILLAVGTKGKRYARPNSTIMLHPLSFGLEADYADQQKKFTTHIDKKSIMLNNLSAKAVGKDLKKYMRDIKDGLWMTAEEAIKHGVIDGINSDPLVTYPGYKYE